VGEDSYAKNVRKRQVLGEAQRAPQRQVGAMEKDGACDTDRHGEGKPAHNKESEIAGGANEEPVGNMGFFTALS
jgi:hypothetical protein